ncbi:43507_t:CDS:2, partial [Gigaspora margarita]
MKWCCEWNLGLRREPLLLDLLDAFLLLDTILALEPLLGFVF